MKIDLKAMGPQMALQLEDLLKNASVKFVQDNSQDAIDLGEDVLQALLAQEIDKVLPMLPPLSENAAPAEIDNREALCTARDTMFATVGEAEAANQDRINALRSKATTVALAVAKGAASIVGGIFLKGLLGL